MGSFSAIVPGWESWLTASIWGGIADVASKASTTPDFDLRGATGKLKDLLGEVLERTGACTTILFDTRTIANLVEAEVTWDTMTFDVKIHALMTFALPRLSHACFARTRLVGTNICAPYLGHLRALRAWLKTLRFCNFGSPIYLHLERR